MLTRQQRARRIAAAELTDLDRDIRLLNEDRARHRLCGGGCKRWSGDTEMIDDLLGLRLTVTDWRDTEAMNERSDQEQGMAQAT